MKTVSQREGFDFLKIISRHFFSRCVCFPHGFLVPWSRLCRHSPHRTVWSVIGERFIPDGSGNSTENLFFQIKKWLLLPFILLEAVRIVFMFYLHSIMMIMLKKKINLGMLIACSAGGAFILREKIGFAHFDRKFFIFGCFFLSVRWLFVVVCGQLVLRNNSHKYARISVSVRR